MKEKALGSTFITKKGVILTVDTAPENQSCRGCYYHSKPKCIKMVCLPEERTDGVSVVFLNLNLK